MKQVDFYLFYLVLFPRLSDKIIQLASLDSEITKKNIIAFKNISNQLRLEREE